MGKLYVGLALLPGLISCGIARAEPAPDPAEVAPASPRVCPGTGNLGLAFQKQQAGDYAEAAALFLQASTQFPALHAMAARSYMENEQLDEAYEQATQAVSLAGGALVTHFVLGLVADRVNRPDIAMSEYRYVLDRMPSDAASHNNLGGDYYMREDFTSARQETEEALSRANNPEGVTIALGNLAELDGLNGMLKDAEVKLNQAMQAAPDQAWAYFGLASLYDVTGRQAEAIAMEQKALELDPHHAAWRATSFVWPELRIHAEALAAEASPDTARAIARWKELEQIDTSGNLHWAPLKGLAALHLAALATRPATPDAEFDPFAKLNVEAPR